MQYNISSLDLRFNHTTRRWQMISVLCMRPPRVRLGPSPSKAYQGTRYIVGRARGGEEDAPTIYCAYGSSQHKWIRGLLLPIRGWCVIAEGRTTYDFLDGPITIASVLSWGPHSLDTWVHGAVLLADSGTASTNMGELPLQLADAMQQASESSGR